MDKWTQFPLALRVGVLGFIFAIVLTLAMPPASALEPIDSGIWSSDQTAQQGFVVQYAPVNPPALVFYWFTHDEAGNQAWFISRNVPVGVSGSEQVVDIFKPICSFASDSTECARGDAVGVLAIGRSGGRLSIRFGISPIEGFTESCASGLTIALRPSPLPPPLPAGDYPCQSELVLVRIAPEVPELAR